MLERSPPISVNHLLKAGITGVSFFAIAWLITRDRDAYGTRLISFNQWNLGSSVNLVKPGSRVGASFTRVHNLWPEIAYPTARLLLHKGTDVIWSRFSHLGSGAECNGGFRVGQRIPI